MLPLRAASPFPVQVLVRCNLMEAALPNYDSGLSEDEPQGLRTPLRRLPNDAAGC